MSCACQKCYRPYKVDFYLPDDVWEKIRDGRNLLCGHCITNALEAQGYGYWFLMKESIKENNE